MNKLVFGHYDLCIRNREIFNSETSLITLEEVDPKSEWITEAISLVFDDEDLEWVDEADREATAVAVTIEDQRATVVPSGTSQALTENTVDPRGTSQAEAMANQSSGTYLRHLTKGHIKDYTEAEAKAKDEDNGEDEDEEP